MNSVDFSKMDLVSFWKEVHNIFDEFIKEKINVIDYNVYLFNQSYETMLNPKILPPQLGDFLL